MSSVPIRSGTAPTGCFSAATTPVMSEGSFIVPSPIWLTPAAWGTGLRAFAVLPAARKAIEAANSDSLRTAGERVVWFR